jgi:uncharacterized protein
MNSTHSSSRRDFLKRTGLATLGFLTLQSWIYRAGGMPIDISRFAEGYGPLMPDPKGILNLPKGFSYTIISKKGDKMNDGFLVPGKADGMASFPGKKGRVILVRNHENNPDKLAESPFGPTNELLSKIDPKKVYDFGKGKLPALGGTTTIVYNPQTGQVENQFLSLVGTVRNCAGGPTPWNSWLTCEESTVKMGAFEGNLEKDHGYLFDVPATEKIHLADPIPLKAMGRFYREAVAVDPRTSIVYMTEDLGDGLLYRFVPNTPRQLVKGGKLQALAIKGQKSCDTRNWEKLPPPYFPLNQPMEVEWIDLDNVESPEDDLRYRGFEKGAARFARAEGAWFGKNEAYFACTNGGKISSGQIFRYVPGKFEGTAREKEAPGKIELFIESKDQSLLKYCDNLTIAPWGDVVLCEDHAHPCIVGITPRGEFYKLGENIGYESEFAGGVFSPDGKTFFVNIQGPGLTFAITGPWKNSL